MTETNDHRRRAEEIFHAALELTPDARSSFVRESCMGDVALQREVDSLLAAREELGDFLGDPVVAPLDVPATIGPYRLVRELGRGGMGEVWLAEQTEPIRRHVALKLIRPGMDSREIISRFHAERQAMALMEHPGVARVFDAGTTDRDQPYFVMEFVDGETITEYCRVRKLRVRDRILLFRQVCDAIQHAHQKTILHRDIKPSNVLVTEVDGQPHVKVIDFGVAKAMGEQLGPETLLTLHGSMIGTPEYMSPEQAGTSRHAVDTRSDVYSLGALLYELLVGALPHEAARIREAISMGGLASLYEDEAPRPIIRFQMLGARGDDIAGRRGTTRSGLESTIRGELEWITMTAIAHDPARRYQSPADLAADLQRYLDDDSVIAAPPSRSYRARKFVRRHRTAVGTFSVLGTALIIAGAGLGIGLLRAVDAEARAMREARTSGEVTAFLVDLFQVNEPGASENPAVTAREILDRGTTEIRGSLGDDPLVRGELLVSMSRAYWGLGVYDQADSLAGMAVDDLVSVLETTDPRLTEARNQWSLSRYYAGDPQGALQIAEEALAIHSTSNSPIDEQALALRNTRAQLYTRMGEIENARGEYRALINVLQEGRTTATRSALVAAWNNHARTFYPERDFERARTSLSRAITVMDSVDLDDEPRRAQIMMNIAATSAQLGDMEEAIEALTTVLPILDRVFGPDHKESIGARMNLAVFLMFEDEYEQALAAFEDVIPRAEASLGADHPQFASVLYNYAITLIGAGRPDEAIEVLPRVLEIRRTVFGEDHYDVVNALVLQAEAYGKAGRNEEAESRFQSVIAVRERTMGIDHPLLADDLDTYGDFLESAGFTERAAEVRGRAVSIRARDDAG